MKRFLIGLTLLACSFSVFIVASFVAAVVNAPTSQTANFPQHFEVRYCHQMANPDEANETVSCSCVVTNWIRNQDGGWIAACEK